MGDVIKKILSKISLPTLGRYGKAKKDNWARNQMKQVFKLGGKLVI